jgi:hypothetical protein
MTPDAAAPLVEHRMTAQLEAGIAHIRSAPADRGRLQLIVRRPDVDEREVLDEAILDTVEGLVGDSWRRRGSRRTPDGSPHPDMQLNLMNARAAALMAVSPERWQLAGDQLYLDLDLSQDNLPPGCQLALGSAVIEITAEPHLGCQKFLQRFGKDALRFVNSPAGRRLRLRGANARVIVAGRVRLGDTIRKLAG